MKIDAFTPIGPKTDVAATTVNTRTAMQVPTALAPAGYTLRVVNEAASPALVAQGDSTVDATTDTGATSVPAGGERIFEVKGTMTHVAVSLRSGTGTVQIQLGAGV